MAFLSFVLFVLAVFVRPGEIIAAWQGFPVAYVVLPMCAVLTSLGLLLGRRFSIVRSDIYVIGLLLAAMTSIVANGWTGGIGRVFTTFGPSVIGYFIARIAVPDQEALRRAIRVIALLSVFLAGNG